MVGGDAYTERLGENARYFTKFEFLLNTPSQRPVLYSLSCVGVGAGGQGGRVGESWGQGDMVAWRLE